ncbi:hypothetical protein [Piscirickettsia litoralis]|uniref:Uncharacterized protein n=1 Tax=Piscirickettsia litoralis TaxID=1891921 RepID=A0ABX3A6C0_9GAMM|nr:hypothetical protein [Piscirickettsia litoralis]ODN43777.1 hypothetical protein BGC07_13825 [Piscirickettsia litoralis]
MALSKALLQILSIVVPFIGTTIIVITPKLFEAWESRRKSIGNILNDLLLPENKLNKLNTITVSINKNLDILCPDNLFPSFIIESHEPDKHLRNLKVCRNHVTNSSKKLDNSLFIERSTEKRKKSNILE